MTLFSGKEHAALLEKKILEVSEDIRKSYSLLIVQIGDDLSSTKYINLKKKLCEKVGITVEFLPLTGNEENIRDIVSSHFHKSSVNGGIIQLPLPTNDLYDCLNLIPVEKDVDLLSQVAKDIFYSGNFTKLSPVIRALDYFIKFVNFSFGKVVIVGDGLLVGKPSYHFLKTLGFDVIIITNYKTGDYIDADLLVLSVGIPNLVLGQNIKAGCHVVDFGSSVVEGVVVGDLSKDSVIDHLGCISLSPGGVGPLVVRFLVMNLLGI